MKKQKKPLVSRPLGVILQLAALVISFTAITNFLAPEPEYFLGVMKVFFGLALLFLGGRTKARA